MNLYWHPRREGMSREETEALVLQAISLAMARDGSSGGVVRMVTINSTGSHRTLVLPEEMTPLWDEFQGSHTGAIV